MQPTVATIDSVTGVATAVANGTATITATVDGVIGQGTLTVSAGGFASSPLCPTLRRDAGKHLPRHCSRDSRYAR